MAAERETIDRLIAHYLADRIGATFDGPHRRASPRRACSSSSTRPAPTASSRPRPSAPTTTAMTRRRMRWSASARGETYRLGDRVEVQAGRGRAGGRRAALRNCCREGRQLLPASSLRTSRRRARGRAQSGLREANRRRAGKARPAGNADVGRIERCSAPTRPRRVDWRMAMRRGLLGRCPACGEGRLFARFLKVGRRLRTPAASELHHHRADDLPPYIVIIHRRPHRRRRMLMAEKIRRHGRSGCTRDLAGADRRCCRSPCCSRSRAPSSACNGRCGMHGFGGVPTRARCARRVAGARGISDAEQAQRGAG